MGVSIRLLIATVISLAFLLVYDRLVIKPRVEKMKAQRSVQVKDTQKKTEEKLSREKNVDIPELSEISYLELSSDTQRIIISEVGVKKVELTKFSLRSGSQERYFFSSPIDILFSSRGKILSFSSSVQDNKIILYRDSLTGVIKFERASDYSFYLRYEFFNSSTLPFEILPIFVLRKSSPEDQSKFIAVSSKVEDLGKSKDSRDIFGEDTRYFVFLAFVPGGVNVFSKDKDSAVLYTQKLVGQKYASFYIKFFAGPKIPDELSKFSENSKVVAGYGFFGPISHLLIFFLEKINSIVGNMGFSVIILSVLIRILFFPLSAVSFRTFKKMKDLQPEIEKIREKYKDDKEKMGREIFELYRREKINPFSGCLPLIIQIPIFIALYNALLHSIDLRHAPFVLWIKDLSEPETLFTVLGFEIHLLPILMGISFFIQQLITPQTYQDQSMKLLNYFMPLIFVFILWNVPSGLHLYWITTNVVGILQQFFAMKFYK